MMIQEFEKLAGFEVTPEEYSGIEMMYYEFDGDKKEFVKWFKKENKMTDVLRDLIQDRDNEARRNASELLAARTAADALAAEIRSLRKKLDHEQEWRPWEDDHNVKQADYQRLADDSDARILDDAEAAQIISDEFGFELSKIRIIREVKQLEINRHGQVRAVGIISRPPRFDVWDWNYIRFDVCGMAYEMHDGALCLYWH